MNSTLQRSARLSATPSLEHIDTTWMPRRRSPVCLGQAPTPHGLSLSPTAAPQAAPTSTPRAPRSSSPAKPTERQVRPLFFEYKGGGSVSIMSSITGRHYRFSMGERVEVDARDGSHLSRVSQLYQV